MANKSLDQILNQFQTENAPRADRPKSICLSRGSTLSIEGGIQLGSKGNAGELTNQATGADTQLLLLRLILIRDRNVGKYLLVFTLFGFLMTCHVAYFFMHVRQLCDLQQTNFALVSGAMMMAHATGEVATFLLVDRYVDWCGRTIALMTCAAVYLLRFGFYGLLLDSVPVEWAILLELNHGLSYAILYSLICQVAIESVDQVDQLLPELARRGLLTAGTRSNELKASLRATMQAVFSGAYDGLGNGLGSLFGGILLNSCPYARLWQVCASLSLTVMLGYPLAEWCLSSTPKQQQQQQHHQQQQQQQQQEKPQKT